MSEESLQIAFARFTEITAVLVKAVHDLSEVGAFIHGHYKIIGTHTFNGACSSEQSAFKNEGPPEDRSKTNHFNNEVAKSVDVAREIVNASGKPLMLAQLFHQVRARGYLVNTRDPQKTYSARLRDHADRVGLIYLRGHGWWLKERPYIDGNYVPMIASRMDQHVN
jgi:hypothetical protein